MAKKHTDEFKQAAVQRMLDGEPVREIAKDLKIVNSLLYTWRNKMEAKRLSGGRKAEFGRPTPATPTSSLNRRGLLELMSNIIEVLKESE